MSRGIVIAAGGELLLSQAYVTIGVLRHVGCHLPVEIWRSKAEEGHPLEARIHQRYGNVSFAATDADSWQIKVAAVTFAAFDEAMLLDADNLVTRDPSYLFDAPAYRKEGAAFWSDIVDIRPTAPAWAQFGLEGQSVRAFESGQLIVDRRRHKAAIETCWAMVQIPDTFGVVYGDKDVWLLGWMKAKAPFARCPYPPTVTGHISIQHDWLGSEVVQHLRRKMRFDGIRDDTPGLVNGLFAHVLAKELREPVNV